MNQYDKIGKHQENRNNETNKLEMDTVTENKKWEIFVKGIYETSN